jgi:colanic acid/amylovoran biosynthesis protein
LTKIVIAGASTYGVKNQGDDAMLDVLCRGLRENIPDVEITFLARHPDKTFDSLFGVTSIKNLDHDSKEESLGRWFRGLNPGDPTDHLQAIRQAIDESALLVIGGNSFMEISLGLFRGTAPYAALLVTLAKFLERPVMLYGVEVAPLQTDIVKELARYVVTNSQLVTVREESSKQELIKLGISDSNIRALADPAFGLTPLYGKAKGKEILDKENIRVNSARVVGVDFRHHYWSWTEEEFDSYGTVMAGMCDYMVENLGVELLFVPNCTYNIDTPYEDDRVIHEKVINKMRLGSHTHQVKGEYSLHEILSLYSLMDMIVSNRRHSLVFGAVQRIPIVGIAFEWRLKPGVSLGSRFHFKNWMESLSAGEQLIHIEEVNSTSWQGVLKKTWDNRETIAGKIAQALPPQREKALTYAKLAADLARDRELSA